MNIEFTTKDVNIIRKCILAMMTSCMMMNIDKSLTDEMYGIVENLDSYKQICESEEQT
ncbi:hypothetical protein CBC_A0803 [Clostridium botulinum C str. Eklund]|nr:hypothetical protein CBC_A0803 [Clostridium botulinum C str. Eklund]